MLARDWRLRIELGILYSISALPPVRYRRISHFTSAEREARLDLGENKRNDCLQLGADPEVHGRTSDPCYLVDHY